MNSLTSQTRRRIFTLYGSNDADSRKDVPFGVSLTLLPILVVKYPENPNFWGVNRRFQAKRAKYWKFHVIETTASISTKFSSKFHVIETTASISTKFSSTIETIKWSSYVFPIGAQQIQVGGRPPFWKKPLNRYISATVWPILTKFGTMTHIGPDRLLKFWIFENSRWRQPPSWKSQKSPYLRSGLINLYEICYADAKWVS